MTDHNIESIERGSPTPLVERPPQALAVNAAHENADLFAQDQSVSLDTLLSRNSTSSAKLVPQRNAKEEHETRGRSPRHARRTNQKLVTQPRCEPKVSHAVRAQEVSHAVRAQEVSHAVRAKEVSHAVRATEVSHPLESRAARGAIQKLVTTEVQSVTTEVQSKS